MQHIKPLSAFLNAYKKPIVISGPCSAENEEQVLQTALQLDELGFVSVFRAGIWKPRTRPKSFDGVGEEGLKWLQLVKQKTNMLTAVEVATPSHVEACLKYGIDIIWVGARTSVNPFSIQEICSALQGVDIIVMVKNTVTPDINLWLGAIERFYQVGIQKLIAIHRGFHTYGKKKYRNEPIWEIPIELKRICPQLPIICDPSHICGNTKLLLEVSQQAIDLDMEGIMIESHYNPIVALTDATQQITPLELKELYQRLILRNPNCEDYSFQDQLQMLRLEIDRIDDILLKSLAERMNIAEKIGKYKKENNVTILQIRRWADLIATRLEKGESLGLEADFLRKLFELVHQASIKRQNDIMNQY